MTTTRPDRPDRPRPSAGRAGARPSARPSALPIAMLLVGLAAVLAAVAILTTRDGDGGTTDAEDRAPVLGGEPLAEYPGPGATDPAIGALAPNLLGWDAAGEQVNPTRTHRPRILLFVAHWCPVCQEEVPLVQSWVDAGGLPDDVDLYGISTGISPARDNYPPEAWLDREGWTAPTIVDEGDVAAEAYGLSAYPYWVVLDADDRVVFRITGKLEVEHLEQLVAAARSG